MRKRTKGELRTYKKKRYSQRRGSASLPFRQRVPTQMQGLLQPGGVGFRLRKTVWRSGDRGNLDIGSIATIDDVFLGKQVGSRNDDCTQLMQSNN